jgi:hypothetical protein
MIDAIQLNTVAGDSPPTTAAPASGFGDRLTAAVQTATATPAGDVEAAGIAEVTEAVAVDLSELVGELELVPQGDESAVVASDAEASGETGETGDDAGTEVANGALDAALAWAGATAIRPPAPAAAQPQDSVAGAVAPVGGCTTAAPEGTIEVPIGPVGTETATDPAAAVEIAADGVPTTSDATATPERVAASDAPAPDATTGGPTTAQPTTAQPTTVNGPAAGATTTGSGDDTDTGDSDRERDTGPAIEGRSAHRAHGADPHPEPTARGNESQPIATAAPTAESSTVARPMAASTSEGVLRSEHVKVLREMAPNREVQRLAVDLDGARISVSFNQDSARVNVLADPSERLGGSWASDVSRSLNAALRQAEQQPGSQAERDRRQRQAAYLGDEQRRRTDTEFADRLGTTTTTTTTTTTRGA